MIKSLVDAIVGGFNGMLTGLGNGVVTFFDSLFVGEGGSLTNFAQVGLVMIGVSLATGIAMWVTHKVAR